MYRLSHTHSAQLLGAGALVVSLTTALEVVTAPYGEAVSLYAANGAVHIVKVIAVVAFVTGMAGLAASLRDRLGTIGVASAGSLIAAVLLGAVPYSIVEASLDRGLSVRAANARLESIYADHAWIGALASVAMPLVLLGVIGIAVTVLRRRILPAWAPWLSLAAIPVAVAAGALGEMTSLPVPHPPAWIFLGLVAYGPALARLDTQPRCATQRAGQVPGAVEDRGGLTNRVTRR